MKCTISENPDNGALIIFASKNNRVTALFFIIFLKYISQSF